MKHVNLLTTAMICTTVIITAGMLARAGELNPPGGAIQPSMHTLDEVYDEVAGLPNQFPAYPLCGGPWEAKHVRINGNVPDSQLTVSGSGVLHSVLISGIPNGIGHAEIIVDGELIAVVGTDFKTLSYIFDIRFETSLEIQRNVNQSSAYVTLLYRPDPTP